jgi:L-seryl-tRNA(Ser) seleniumtransferase
VSGGPSPARVDPRRGLPSIDALLAADGAGPLVARWGRTPVAEALRRTLADLREDPAGPGEIPSEEGIIARAGERLAIEARPGLHRVLNGTGVVLHTNLGRAPLSIAPAPAAPPLAPR